MSIFLILVRAISQALNALSSAKTRRYFWREYTKETVILSTGDSSPNGGEETAPEIVVQLVKTFLAIMGKRATTSVITVGSEAYPVSSYTFPEAFWKLAGARRIYVSPNSSLRMKPWFAFMNVESEDGLLSPESVNRFFAGFNLNQEEDVKIKVTAPPDTFNDDGMIYECQALTIKPGLMGDFNPNGCIDHMATQILGVPHPCAADGVAMWKSYDEEGVAKWLMGLRW